MAHPHGTGPQIPVESVAAATALASVRRLIEYVLKYRRNVIFAVVWLLVSSATAAAVPALIGYVVDQAVRQAAGAGEVSALNAPIALLAAVTIAGWFAQRAQIIHLGNAGQRALFVLRQEVFAKLHVLPVAYFESSAAGDLMSRLVNDIETVNSFMSQGLRRLIGSMLVVVATVVAMFIVDARLALVTLLALPFLMATAWVFGKVSRRVFRQRQVAIGNVSALLAEELAGIKVAQSFARSGASSEAFDARNAANRDASINASAISSAFEPALTLISTIATVLVAGYGGMLAAGGVITVGVVVAFFNYARQFFNSISQISTLWGETQSAIAGSERVFTLLDAQTGMTDPPDAVDLMDPQGSLGFSKVNFGYAEGPQVLFDVSFQVLPGETVALVGMTGAGKSTILDLISKMYAPDSGEITIDGVDIHKVTTPSLRRILGVVGQEPFLFTGTVADNLRYARSGVTDDEIRSTLLDVGGPVLLESLPEGIDTRIGERGLTLSGGQRQLLALARVMLSDPSILLLDEATSAVDSRTETQIHVALDKVFSERTAIVIAHRLSTVKRADRIIVIEDGRVVESGTYRELMAAGGYASNLFCAQII
ncbi:MAG: ABC transporter ATP-binding protein/permease [Actinobacteria bacterium]|nr:ABC transporter ATP-binding protein/permease [Actinomycetota bacterium]MCL5887100.1 ABC transporter ATP-binding protein/permease [Actinomycetota bacterium]